MNARRRIAFITLLSLLYSMTTSSLAKNDAISKKVPSAIRQTEVWPGGSVQELWHSQDELSLYVEIGPKLVEFRFRGNAFALEASVIIDGEERWLDYDALRQSTVFDNRGPIDGRMPSSRARTNRGADNDATLRWIRHRTGGAGLELSEDDSKRIISTVAKATNLDLIEKGGCVHNTRAALGAGAAWMYCIAGVAVSAGASLAPCFVIGAGAYFLGFSAVQSCAEAGQGGGIGGDGCSCSGDSPDCMCCSLDPGAVCACYCPGEDCCEWDDAIGG